MKASKAKFHSIFISIQLSEMIGSLRVKTVCKEMYQHWYYLNPDEYKNSEEMIQTNLEPPSKVPKTTKDHNNLYKYVLPSTRTILKYKHLQATQEETNADVAFLTTSSPAK